MRTSGFPGCCSHGPCSERERAALAWTEALTQIAETHAPDADYELLQKHFSAKEVADLTILIGMINLWNRVAVGMRTQHPVNRVEAIRERA